MIFADTIAQYITDFASNLLEAAASATASVVNALAALFGGASGPEAP